MASAAKTRMPLRRLMFQNTLAVPARVLPVAKMSMPRRRATRWAKGMEPRR